MDFEQIKSVVLSLDRMGEEPSREAETARLACVDLAYSSYALTDFGRAAKVPDLYVPDAMQCMDGVLIDRAGRLERYTRRQADTTRKTRHVLSNYLFRLGDAQTGYAMYVVMVFLEDRRGTKGVTPLVVADCADQYVRGANGTWRIGFRHLQGIAGAAR